MEYWDLYDYTGKKKNKIAIRGAKLNNDDFHLVVNAWIINDDGEFLITQRSANKSHPLMWECTGGSALIGESSLQAAIREVKEELGIDVSGDGAIFIGESRRFYDSCPDILHVWLFKSNEKIDNVRIQEEEVNDVMWASRKKILQLLQNNKFEANAFFNRVINSNAENYMKNNINDKLNNEYIRKLIKDKVPMLNMKFIDEKIDFDTAKKMTDSDVIVIQDKIESCENNTFYIDNEEKFNKYISMCNNKYYLLKYIESLPINVIAIIGDKNDVVFPTSIKLVELKDDKLKYAGADFIYSQNLNNAINNKIKEYSSIIVNEARKQGYRGAISIDYIIDENDNVYFIKINSYFKTSFIINKYLSKYCFTSIEELHYLAITNGYVCNTYLDKIDNSFVNCSDVNDYEDFKYYEIIDDEHCSNNKLPFFRKVFNYSVLKNGIFQKRNIDK